MSTPNRHTNRIVRRPPTTYHIACSFKATPTTSARITPRAMPLSIDGSVNHRISRTIGLRDGAKMERGGGGLTGGTGCGGGELTGGTGCDE
jgi:hypothetical protein